MSRRDVAKKVLTKTQRTRRSSPRNAEGNGAASFALKNMPPASPSRTDAAVTATTVLRRVGSRTFKRRKDSLAAEEPLEIRVQGRSVAVTMRTPGHDRELAAGFLLTEGIIHERKDVIEIMHCRAAAAPENTLNVFLAPLLKLDFAQLTRHVFATSSCGLCGKASIESVHQNFPPVASDTTVAVQTLTGLPRRCSAPKVS